jgi:hypothetical protein
MTHHEAGGRRAAGGGDASVLMPDGPHPTSGDAPPSEPGVSYPVAPCT